MNENLNLVEKLKDVTRGTKLWSPICGDCYFQKIIEKNCYLIVCTARLASGDYGTICFTVEGVYFNKFVGGECALFPSKENRDWSIFKVPKKHKEFELNQKVLVGLAMNNQYIWRRDIYLNYDENKKCHCTFYESMVPDSLIIPYDPTKDGKPVPTKYYMCVVLIIRIDQNFWTNQIKNSLIEMKFSISFRY